MKFPGFNLLKINGLKNKVDFDFVREETGSLILPYSSMLKM
jgi:hypothetical protein